MTEYIPFYFGIYQMRLWWVIFVRIIKKYGISFSDSKLALIMDIVDRTFFESNSLIREYCTENFWEDCQIRYCNFWFVAIPVWSSTVYKYYLIWSNYAHIESVAYNLFRNHDIIVPKYFLEWTHLIWGMEFQRASIENIRIYWPRKQSFLEFDIEKLAKVIFSIHGIQKNYIHANIHPSNFYTLPNWDIWVFDLSTYATGSREKDIARIFIHSGYDRHFLFQFLSMYNYTISLKKVYLLALIETRELHITGRADWYLKQINKLIELIKA